MADLIGAGLQQQIEGFLKQEPETRLIVIDTLQRVRGLGYIAQPMRMITGTSAIKQLADKHRIAIILVHHLRKHTDKGPFMMVSGTTGLTGGVDTTYVLEKDKRSDATHLAFWYFVIWSKYSRISQPLSSPTKL